MIEIQNKEAAVRSVTVWQCCSVDVGTNYALCRDVNSVIILLKVGGGSFKWRTIGR